MPTIIQTVQGRVTGIWGSALIRGANGKMQVLKLGELVHKGDVILTSQNGIVQLSPEDSPTAVAVMGRVPAAPNADLDRVISALNDSDAQAATAAGLNAADGAGDLAPGLRVDRIAESLRPTSLVLPQTEDGMRRDVIAGGEQVVEPPSGASIAAGSNIINATEQGPDVGLGLSAPTGTTGAAVIGVGQVPVFGQLQKADGTPVIAGTVLTPAELSGLKYVPPADYNGTDPVGEFVYTVTEGANAVTGSVGIVVTPVNDPPLAVADADVTPEDTPISGNVLGNDTDVDGPSLSVTQYSIAGVVHTPGTPTVIVGVGTIVVAVDGNYTFTPAPHYSGPVPPIGYTISDGSLISTSTLSLTVTPVDDAPAALDDTGSGPEDTLQTGNVLGNDSDLDGTPLSVTQFVVGGATFAAGASAALAGVGSLLINADGSYTFTPLADYHGPVPVATCTITDGTTSTTATLTLSVTPVADIVADSVATREDTPITFNPITGANELAGVDNFEGTALLTAVGTPSHGTVSFAAGGSITYTPAANYSGPDSFTYTVTSGGVTETTTISILVTPDNLAPVALNDAGSAPEDTAQTGNVLTNDNDPDGNPLGVTQFIVGGATFAAGTTAALAGVGTLVINPDGSYAFTPVADYNGSVPVATYTVSDGITASTATLALAVTPVVDIVDDSVATTEDTPISFNPITGANTIGGSDNFENATRALTVVGVPAHGMVSFAADGTITYTPAANYSGPDSFTYTVTSGGVTETATININVAPADDAPSQVVPVAQATVEDTGKVITGISVADVDSASLTTTLTVAHGTLTVTGGSGATVGGVGTGTVVLTGSAAQINAALAAITYSPTADFNGADSLSISTSDGTSTTNSSVAIAVSAVADVVDDRVVTVEDTVVTFNPISGLNELGGADNFEGPPVLTAVGTPAHGTVAFTPGGAITYTPAANYNGPDSFTYTITSGGVTETATITIDVTPVNDARAPTLSIVTVGQWIFDEGAGNSTTDAYNAQTGALDDSTPAPAASAPSWTAGHAATSGSALHFNGDGGFVALAPAVTAPLMGTASLSFWIKTTQLGEPAGWNSPAVIASEQNSGANDIQWGAINDLGQIGLGLGDVAGVYSTTSVNDNAWHQIAITRDAVTKLVSVYVDGILEATGSPDDADFTGLINRLTGFGATNNFAADAAATDLPDDRFLNADLDDLRIYDHVLTADQVAAIKAVEGGYHDTAVANDGDAIRMSLAAADYTSLSVSGLNTGMVISDGAGGHTATIGAAGPDTSVDLTGWDLSALSVSGAGTGSATLAFVATNTVAGESRTTTQYLNIVNGSSLLSGAGGDDTLTGTANADLLAGHAGNDVLDADAGNDRLLGGAGNDALNGGDGRDIVYGGAGDDTMTGGNGTDTFAWTLADRGTGGAPARDSITDFNVAAVASGGDTLDLRDLLVGANHVGTNPGNLEKYLDFDTTSTPGSTIIHVSSTGGFAGGSYAPGSEDERITLQGVDLRASFGLDAGSSDGQVIQELLTRSKLVTDGAP